MVSFLTSVAPIEPMGLPLGFYTLLPRLHSHDRRHQSPRISHLYIPTVIEPTSNHPHL